MKYKKGYKYVLAVEEVFQTAIFPADDIVTDWIRLSRSGQLALVSSYAWDGSTWAMDTRWCMRASAAHDAICQLIKAGLLNKKWKRQGDLEYYNLCIQDGMPLMMAINRLFWMQFHSWENTTPSPILTAP